MRKKNGSQFSLMEKEMYYDGEKIKEYIEPFFFLIGSCFKNADILIDINKKI